MQKTVCLSGIIAALATLMIAFDANAFSISPLPKQSSYVMPVAGGCGLSYHRGPYGGCRPNAVGYPAVGYRGGVYRGGVYRGGVYHGGGAYRRGGVYHGGAYRRGRVYRR